MDRHLSRVRIHVACSGRHDACARCLGDNGSARILELARKRCLPLRKTGLVEQYLSFTGSRLTRLNLKAGMKIYETSATSHQAGR